MKSNNLREGMYEFLDFPMEKWAEESGEGNGKEEVGGSLGRREAEGGSAVWGAYSRKSDACVFGGLCG